MATSLIDLIGGQTTANAAASSAATSGVNQAVVQLRPEIDSFTRNMDIITGVIVLAGVSVSLYLLLRIPSRRRR